MDRLESTYHFNQNYFKPWVFRQNHRANFLQQPSHRAPVGSHHGIFGHQIIGFGHLGALGTASTHNGGCLRKNPRIFWGNHQWFHQWCSKLFCFHHDFGGKSPNGPQSQVETPEKSCGNHPIGEISRYLTGFIIELNVDCLGRKKIWVVILIFARKKCRGWWMLVVIDLIRNSTGWISGFTLQILRFQARIFTISRLPWHGYPYVIFGPKKIEILGEKFYIQDCSFASAWNDWLSAPSLVLPRLSRSSWRPSHGHTRQLRAHAAAGVFLDWRAGWVVGSSLRKKTVPKAMI